MYHSSIQRMEQEAKRLLLASILAMEPSSQVLQHARAFGNGRISQEVQRFVLISCLHNPTLRKFPPTESYLRSLLKQLILVAEDEGEEVMDSLYKELMEMLNSSRNEMETPASRCYRTYLYSISDDSMMKISGCIGSINASAFTDMMVTLRVSSNMLEGDTGCFVWPAGLFLSEFLLANPGFFTGRCCVEIGAGTGLNSICLARLKASKIIATDGDPLTLANLKHNFLVNGMLPNGEQRIAKVEFTQLIWETATEDVIQNFGAEIMSVNSQLTSDFVLRVFMIHYKRFGLSYRVGADIIYDGGCIPHLVRLLSCFLNCKRDQSDHSGANEDSVKSTESMPIAFLATAIRNENTLNTFISSAELAGLFVEDITRSANIPVFLPYIPNIDRSRICLHRIRSRR